MPANPGFFTLSFDQRRSIDTGRLHQRKQLVDGLLRCQPHPIGVLHSGDVDALHHGSDLVAKVGEKTQGIRRVVGDTRNQAGDQELASDHASVQFVHLRSWLHPTRFTRIGHLKSSKSDISDFERGLLRSSRSLCAAIWRDPLGLQPMRGTIQFAKMSRRARAPARCLTTGNYLAAISPGSAKPLIRSLMSLSVLRLVCSDAEGMSCNT